MADTKISALTAATTPLAGTEVLPIVQSGATVKATVANIVGAGTSAGAFTTLTATNASTAAAATFTSQFGSTNTNDIAYFQRTGSAVKGVIGYDASAATGDKIYFGTTTAQSIAFRVGGTDYASLSTTEFTLNNGNLVIGTSGKGIDFSATSHPAGMTSELLADYEEGTWTPTQGTGLTVVGTFSSSGSYTKVGRMVTVRGRVSGSTSVSIVANSQLCAGLPFTGTTGVEAEEGALTDNNITQVGVAQIYGATVYSTAITATTRMNFTISYFV